MMNDLMKQMGFMIYESSVENENDCFPPILFERQLSLRTSLIVEAEKNGQGTGYEYSFYKIQYIFETNAIKEIKMYLLGGNKIYLLERVFGWFLKVPILPDEVMSDLKKKIKISENKKRRKRYSQREINEQRKMNLGVI